MSELEAPSAEFRITSANRQAVKDWLAAQGFDATRVQSMRDQTLLKAYTDPHYLRALTNRGDYNPSVERNGNERAGDTLREGLRPPVVQIRGNDGETAARINDKGTEGRGQGANADRSGADLSQRSVGVPLNSMAEAELATAPAGPENTQVVAAAQAGGCCRECGSLTEARVIELIRALAVLKPTGLEGLEDLL